MRPPSESVGRANLANKERKGLNPSVAEILNNECHE
jgi:hypothetical protein